MWFGFRGGGRLLVRRIHMGDRFFAENWPDDKRGAFLDWAGGAYNMLSIASHYLNRDAEGEADIPPTCGLLTPPSTARWR